VRIGWNGELIHDDRPRILGAPEKRWVDAGWALSDERHMFRDPTVRALEVLDSMVHERRTHAKP
jgi:hypothetical protein